MTEIPDVDIDVADRDKVLALFPNAIPASQLSSDRSKLVQHNTGVYLQNLQTDPLNGLATFPYDSAEELGYYKIDFIPFHIYENIEDNDHLQELIDHAESDDFDWSLFQERRFFISPNNKKKLTHLGGYLDLCTQYPPQSILDVATLIALIRPRKKYLIGDDWDVIQSVIWEKLEEEETDGEAYFFKKSHAVGYALAVLVHIQLLQEILA